MKSFQELAASRRQWIDETLRPWCRTAARKDLLLAELEWQDIAGRPAPEMTLWLWAWARFPALVADGLPTINETDAVRVTMRDGSQVEGYPDARRSTRGQLVLLRSTSDWSEPLSLDDITSVERVDL